MILEGKCQPSFKIGEYVWIDSPADLDISIGGCVTSIIGDQIEVVDDEERKVIVKTANKMHISSIQGVSDMISLAELTEATILRNLRVRYKHDEIYTYIGTILISLNPYRTIDELYSRKTAQSYKKKRMGERSPHIFAIADCAYFKQLSGINQVLIISGESGSGKTESTKLVLQYLAQVSGRHSWIEQQLLDSNPILEAFGNAKTTRNDNSSRFGKYIDIYFDEEGSIMGAKIDQYLLEKSRIIRQEYGERNYHIFYWLLAGLTAEEKKPLMLNSPKTFKYLGDHQVDSDDVKQWNDIQSAFRVLMFPEQQVNDIFTLLAALLHLGEIKFTSKHHHNMDSGTIIRECTSLTAASHLLQVETSLLVAALTNRTILASGQAILTSLETEQASDIRDAFVKGIYGKLFDWVVKFINNALNGHIDNQKHHMGVLDVFGFEELAGMTPCGFEQFCINYANERLQQFFIRHVFKLEQHEYESEGVDWRKINFSDNEIIVELIANNNMSIISLIDEETIFPRGTDSSLCAKINYVHKQHPNYIVFPGNTNIFGIRHFAGDVKYRCYKFLDKNRDAFSGDLLDLIFKSRNSFIREIFNGVTKEEATGTRKKGRTLLSHFKRSLEALMDQMSLSCPHFIRCLRPNTLKKPDNFDSLLILKQLRYSGIIDTIKIRRSGYPIRFDLSAFVRRYGVIVKSPTLNNADVKKTAEQICSYTGIIENIQIGHTKIFLRDIANVTLEHMRQKCITSNAVIIQSYTRMFSAVKKFEAIRLAALTIQTCWRTQKLSEKQAIINHGFERLQALYHARLLSLSYCRLNESVKNLQSRCRGHLARKKFQKMQQSRSYLSSSNVATNKFTTVDEDFVETIFERILAAEDQETEKNSQYRFIKFARTYFQGGVTHSYSTKTLRRPLLLMNSNTDHLAALACWIVILRFMGDMKEEFSPSSDSTHRSESIVCYLHNTLSRGLTDLETQKSLNITSKLMSKSQPSTKINRSLKRRSKMTLEANDVISSKNPFLPSRALTSLEKIHFIISLGIMRPTLRDEIFCQIVKQLTGNTSKRSFARGWLLLTLTVSSFAPSSTLLPYIKNFIKNGPASLSEYCHTRLTRTIENGSRSQPPSWLELHATKTRKDITVPVTLMDGTTQLISIDSASIAKELCEAISERIGLNDKFGFAIFVAVSDKVNSIGAGSDHVLDAISCCEQYWKEKQSTHERSAPWRLFFRKELFLPWHDPSSDPVATNLIYYQVCRGLKFGEYKCEKLHELRKLVSSIFIIESGDMKSLTKLLPHYLPEYIVCDERWIELVKDTILDLCNESHSALALKEQIVKYAHENWPLLFSRFYESNIVSGLSVRGTAIIAVNYSGLSIIDENEQVILYVSFPEMITVSSKGPENARVLTLTIVGEKPIVLNSSSTDEIRSLLVYFLDGLKKRSIYLISLDEYDICDNLKLHKGDLLILNGSFSGEYLNVLHKASSKKGFIPKSIVHVLPTMTAPSLKVIKAFKRMLRFNNLNDDIENEVNNEHEEDDVKSMSIMHKNNAKLHTLENFAKENFTRSQSWTFQKHPIETPLLQKLQNCSLTDTAIKMFELVLKYMISNTRRMDLTDAIIKPVLSNEMLRDELYCQLVKQITEIKKRYECRIWELLWLLTGCCAPTHPILYREIEEVLRSHAINASSLSFDCLRRLQKIAKRGTRKFPPIQIELEAIQHGTTQILHKVYLPDGTDQAFEVESSSRAKDICMCVVNRLRIKSPVNNFGLFVRIAGRSVTIPSADFFFDFIRSIMTVMSKAPQELSYQVVFMRKLWINVIPSFDYQADILIHFHQELQNYLKGYHVLEIDAVPKISALVYRSLYGTNRTFLTSTTNYISSLLPENVILRKELDVWSKEIQSEYENFYEISQNEAKIEFLRLLSPRITFGSAYFDVIQTSNDDLPSSLALGINEHGVILVDTCHNCVVVVYPYKQLSNWTSGNSYFHLTVGDLISGTKLLFETNNGYKMDDLLTSYVSILIERHLSTRPRVTNIVSSTFNYVTLDKDAKNDNVLTNDT